MKNNTTHTAESGKRTREASLGGAPTQRVHIAWTPTRPGEGGKVPRLTRWQRPQRRPSHMRRCDARLLHARLRCFLAYKRGLRTTGACCSVASAAPAASATAVLSLLRSCGGLTQHQVDTVLERDPLVLTYDPVTEVAPRLSQLRYLHANSSFAWQVQGESVADFIVRQPYVLERRFLPVDPEQHKQNTTAAAGATLRNYYAVSKPWDVRHDVPRGWKDSNGVVERFTPKHEGDNTSAEEYVTAACVGRPPFNWARVRFAHQIDYATSGVLLACGTQGAAAAAAGCFKHRTARKSYAALLLGDVKQDAWTVDGGIAPDEADPSKFKMRLGDISEGAKAAVTAFTVRARGTCALEGPWHGAPVALVAVQPLTGRRHQIRVLAAASGTPVLGDCAYSPDTDSFRMMLHAWRLELPGILAGGEGETAADLRLTAPVPRSLRVAFNGPWPTDMDAQ